MEIKVGIQHVNREIVVDSKDSAKDVEKRLGEALETGNLLVLADSRGRQVLIPAAAIGYLEIGEEHARVVGFGAV